MSQDQLNQTEAIDQCAGIIFNNLKALQCMHIGGDNSAVHTGKVKAMNNIRKQWIAMLEKIKTFNMMAN